MDAPQSNEIFSHVVPPDRSGIGGWLYFLVVHLTLLPAASAIGLLRVLYVAVSKETETRFVLLSSSALNATWLPYLAFELLFKALLLMGSIILITLFFRQRRVVPRLVMAYFIILVIHALMVVVYTKIVHADTLGPTGLEASSRAMQSLYGQLLAAGVWLPYLILSKRVRSTFVE